LAEKRRENFRQEKIQKRQIVSMHQSKTLLMTFTRNPELGKVKSRLAKGIGEKAALEVYIKLLEHTENVLQKINVDKCVWYSVSVRQNDIWRNDVVIGPAKDGGYYLLGMKTLHKKAFAPKAWGTETVLADTLNDLDNQNIHLLETLNDIDHAEDLEPYEAFKNYLL